MEVSYLTTFELQKHLKRFKTRRAILPVGSIEQHGKFLPINTDTIIAEGAARWIDEFFDNKCFIFPSIYFSNADACRNYPGTVTVGHDLFRELLRQVLQNIVRCGFHKIIIVNAHAINESSINEISFEHNLSERQETGEYKHEIIPVNVYKYYDIVQKKYGLTPGKHADWLENLLIEYFDLKKAEAKEFLLYSRSKQKEKNDTVKYVDSKILGEFIENRSRNGVIGKSLPEKRLSDKEKKDVANSIMKTMMSGIMNKLK